MRILLILPFFLSFSKPVAKSQEIESGIFNCIQQKYLNKGVDWKNTCDSAIFILLNKAGPYTKQQILDVCNDTGWHMRGSQVIQDKMLFIRLDSILNHVAEDCLTFFSHRDGHEQKTRGEISEFTRLFTRKAQRMEYIEFYRQLPEDLFMHPFYVCFFVSWLLL